MVIIPIIFKGKEEMVQKKCQEVYEKIENQGWRVHLDDRDSTPGGKYYEWELKGVPLRVDIGPRDIEKGTVTLVRRDGKKIEMLETTLLDGIKKEMDDYGESLMHQAQTFSDNLIHRSDSPKKAVSYTHLTLPTN